MVDTAKMRAAFLSDWNAAPACGGYQHQRCAIRVLCDEVDRLRALVAAQAERIADQSELLSKRAEGGRG